jgi:trigger factor
MQVTEEKKDALNVVLNVKIEPNDYSEKLDKSIKTYAKQVSIPGFRTGKVPIGMVKKKYGKALLAEELNKIVSESIDGYIKEKQLDVLGSPLPHPDDSDNGNWDQPENFTFKYDVGLAPEVDITLDKRIKQNYFVIEVDNKMVEEHIEDLRKRFGKITDAEVAEESDMLVVDLLELNENGEIKEDGVKVDSTVTLQELTDKETKNELLGVKVGDEPIIVVRHLARNDEDFKRMLRLEANQENKVGERFKVLVKEIKRMIPAEKDEEFFKKASGKEEITTEEAFKALIVEDTSKRFSQESDRLFLNTMHSFLIEKAKLDLPDAFLKRWIQATNDNPISKDEVEADYPNYSKSLQWQLIENKLVKDAGIEISREDTFEKAKGFVVAQYAHYGLPAPDEENLKAHVNQMLSNQDEVRKLVDLVLEERIIRYLKDAVKLTEKKVSYQDFVKQAQSLQ